MNKNKFQETQRIVEVEYSQKENFPQEDEGTRVIEVLDNQNLEMNDEVDVENGKISAAQMNFITRIKEKINEKCFLMRKKKKSQNVQFVKGIFPFDNLLIQPDCFRLNTKQNPDLYLNFLDPENYDVEAVLCFTPELALPFIFNKGVPPCAECVCHCSKFSGKCTCLDHVISQGFNPKVRIVRGYIFDINLIFQNS